MGMKYWFKRDIKIVQLCRKLVARECVIISKYLATECCIWPDRIKYSREPWNKAKRLSTHSKPLFSVFTTSHQQTSGLYLRSVNAVVMWLCIILIRCFCFRCWGRWLLRCSINMGSAASTSALKPVVKDCLTYQSFIWRWVRIILPLSLAPCCPAFRTSLKRSKYAA